MRHLLLPGLLAALAGLAHSAAAGTYVPIQQDRTTATVVQSDCDGETTDGDTSFAPGKFESLAGTFQSCPGGPVFASATAHQTSMIGTSSMDVFAGAQFDLESPASASASSSSSFSVTFELPRTSLFTATGLLLGSGAVASIQSRLEMTGLAGNVFTLSLEGPFPFGEPTEQDITEVHVIEPGVYTVTAHAFAADATNATTGFLTGEAALNVAIEVGFLGDANGDMTVDVQDLLLVILNWGMCPGPPTPCIGDVDGNGEINVLDLLTVVLTWG